MSRFVITPPARVDLPRARELWDAREVLYRFGQRDVILRYRQTVIGVAWVLLQPLASAGIFAIVFGRVAQLPSQGVPYFVFAFVGTLAWNLFSSVVSRSSSSLVANQALVSKVFFPRMLVPLSTSISVIIDFLVSLTLGIVLVAAFGIGFGWQVLLVPVWALLVILLASGIGLVASALMVKYRDVGYVLPWLVQFGLYASPVAYSLEAVPDNLLIVFNLNPMTWALEAFRFSLLGLPAPPLWQIAGLVVVALGAFVTGALVFQKFERGFADFI